MGGRGAAYNSKVGGAGRRLGDSVKYNGEDYTIIKTGSSLLTLRPSQYVDEDDFPGSNDFNDIQIAPYQLPTKVSASNVSVSTSEFVMANGKNPRGTGNWAFEIDGEMIFYYGKYSDALKKAKKEAANRGATRIKLGS